MKKKWRLLFFLLGLAGIAILLIESDPATFDWSSFFSVNLIYLFIAIIGLWVVIYLLHTLCYKVILLDESKKVRFSSMMKIVTSGFALNNVTPAGLVGGEPYRIMELRRFVSTERATSSTLTFTLFYVFGHLALWVTGVALYLVLGCPGDLWLTISLCVVGGLFLAGILWFFIARKNGFVMPVMKLLSKLPLVKKPILKLLEKKEASFIEIDDNIREFRTHRYHFYAAFLLEYVSRLLEATEYFIILYFLGANLHLYEGIVVMALASLVGNLLFIIPMQAGSREGGMALALSFFNIDGGFGVQTGIIYRVRDLLFTAVGIFLVLFERHKNKTSEETPEVTETKE